MSDCPRFPPLAAPPVRPLLGAGATIGPIRAICAAVVVAGSCGAAGAGSGLALRAAKPPAAAPAAHGDPVAIPAPGGALLFALPALLLMGMIRR
jgi:hypothetical protein